MPCQEDFCIQLLWVLLEWNSVQYQFVGDVIENFDDDGEKSVSLYAMSVSGDDIVFKNINRKCSVILGLW